MKSIALTQTKNLLSTFTLGILIASPGWAATKTVTLTVPGMTCAACPFTVKAALSRVDGVSKTEVQFEKREAKVSFDDAKTSAQALMKATSNAGYPSSVKN